MANVMQMVKDGDVKGIRDLPYHAECLFEPDKNGFTPASFAATLGRTDVFRAVAERNAPLLCDKDRPGNPALTSPLVQAASKGDAQMVKEVVSVFQERLLDHSMQEEVRAVATFVNIPDGEGVHALVAAVSASRISLVGIELLLSYGADPDTRRAPDGVPVLHVAVRRALVEVVKLLLRRGANPNILAGPMGWTPLHSIALGVLQMEKGVNGRPDVKEVNGIDDLYARVASALRVEGAESYTKDDHGRTLEDLLSSTCQGDYCKIRRVLTWSPPPPRPAPTRRFRMHF